MELITPQQVSNNSKLGRLVTRQQCCSSMQWVARFSPNCLGCQAGHWVNCCRQGHPRLIVFPFIVWMNHGVRTRCQLHCLFPHETMWEREATYWQGSCRHDKMTGNMEERSMAEWRLRILVCFHMSVWSYFF